MNTVLASAKDPDTVKAIRGSTGYASYMSQQVSFMQILLTSCPKSQFSITPSHWTVRIKGCSLQMSSSKDFLSLLSIFLVDKLCTFMISSALACSCLNSYSNKLLCVVLEILYLVHSVLLGCVFMMNLETEMAQRLLDFSLHRQQQWDTKGRCWHNIVDGALAYHQQITIHPITVKVTILAILMRGLKGASLQNQHEGTWKSWSHYQCDQCGPKDCFPSNAVGDWGICFACPVQALSWRQLFPSSSSSSSSSSTPTPSYRKNSTSLGCIPHSLQFLDHL